MRLATWALQCTMVRAIHLSQIMRNLYSSVLHSPKTQKHVTGEKKTLLDKRVPRLSSDLTDPIFLHQSRVPIRISVF